MVLSNLHTHSVFSDGNNTVEEIVHAAIERGYVSLGMSDHSYTSFDDSFCMRDGVFDDYVAEVNRVREKYRDSIDVLCGMELDYYSENIPVEKLDYVVGSVHYVKAGGIYYGVDHTAEGEQQGIDEGCGGDVHAYIRAYYDNICDHVTKNKIDVVGHFDVLTKFSLFDEEDPFYKKTALDAIDLIVEKGIITEINTGAVFKKLRRNPYPALFILKRIAEKGGRVCIDADAHVKENIHYWFDESAELMKEVGFRTAAMITKNGFVDYEL